MTLSSRSRSAVHVGGALAAMGLLVMASLAAAVAWSQVPPPPAADWRDGGVCYEVFVRSFYDSDGDGVGDLRGLTQKLDYINDGDPEGGRDLGANCIWLMPIAASGSYHGYDPTDYYRVDPRYGTNEDFVRFVREAHRRGIRVLVDVVINHSSSDHPAFQEALGDPDSPYREWYRWRPGQGPPNEFGGQNWHPSPLRDEYYYGFFWVGMPDLNWESASLRQEMKDVATFWLEEMGVDGFRLDAVRHLMETEDGRSANVPRTHDMLREYGAHIRRTAPGAFTVGEVFDSTAALVPYYPDQLDAYFAFQVANAILDAASTGSGARLMAAVTEIQSSVPDRRWAPFLRNHDQTRTMTWLGDDAARARLAAGLLLTLPGLPFVYYGEELGMTGDKPDPRIRTPMHWSVGRAAGFTTGEPWEPLQPDSLTANVAVMDADPASLLNHYRALIHLRAGSAALGAGDFLPLSASDPGVAAYLRTGGGDVALVVANLGTEAVTGVTLSSPGAVLPSGRHAVVDLLGEHGAAPMEVGTDGRVTGYQPLPTLEPLRLWVFGVSPAGD